MNGREMSRQTSAKQTNAQIKPMQPNTKMVESAGRRLLPKKQKAVLAATTTRPKATSIIKNRLNVQLMNLAKI